MNTYIEWKNYSSSFFWEDILSIPLASIKEKYKEIKEKIDLSIKNFNWEWTDDYALIKLKLDKSTFLLEMVRYYFHNNVSYEAIKNYNESTLIFEDILQSFQTSNLLKDDEIAYTLQIWYLLTKTSEFLSAYELDINIVNDINDLALYYFDDAINQNPEREKSLVIKLAACEIMWKNDEVLRCHYDLLSLNPDFLNNYKEYGEIDEDWKITDLDIDRLIIENKAISKVDWIIFKMSSVWAVMWIQPIPFLDYFLLIPLQTYMIIQIWKVYWIKMDVNMSKALLFQLVSILWFEYIKTHLILWFMKIWLPFVAWYINIPLYFALIYWMWKAINAYFYYKSKNSEISNEELRLLFKENRFKWLEIWKKSKDEVKRVWRNLKWKTLETIWSLTWSNK